MSQPTDDPQSGDNDVREGTEALQKIADDLVAERERSGHGLDDTTDDSEAETREDHLEPDVNTPLDQRLEDQK